jgi:hypothetical protein
LALEEWLGFAGGWPRLHWQKFLLSPSAGFLHNCWKVANNEIKATPGAARPDHQLSPTADGYCERQV